MASVPSAAMWGSPAATKSALLIHGLTSASHTWHGVATSLASQGYLVTAPNLVGHASRVSTDYRMSFMAEDLLPYFIARNYDLIIGHSLGGLLAMELFKYLPRSLPVAFVLLDPPLKFTQEEIRVFDKMFTDIVENVKEAGVISTENPLWSREDCMMREVATRSCSVEAVHGILGQNMPWCFNDNFNAISSRWKVTVLIADPNLDHHCFLEDVKPFPQLRVVGVPRAGHWIQSDFPGVVVEEALKTVSELKARL